MTREDTKKDMTEEEENIRKADSKKWKPFILKHKML